MLRRVKPHFVQNTELFEAEFGNGFVVCHVIQIGAEFNPKYVETVMQLKRRGRRKRGTFLDQQNKLQ